MKVRSRVLILSVLLLLVTAWLLWPSAERSRPVANTPAVAASTAPAQASASSANSNSIAPATAASSTASTNRLAFRLTNTAKKLGQLTTAAHAILLENALVDTDAKINLSIPEHLRADGEPGAYIVQARGVIDGHFRALLAAAGGQVVSYIPNNAYLVQLSSVAAGALAGNPQVQAVLPYEPYYKVQLSLLGRAVEQQPLTPGTALNLGLFASSAAQTEAQLVALGAKIIGTPDRSPFGPIVRVLPPADWTALARLPGVQVMEPAHQRVTANDLSRVTVGETTDTISGITNNWLGLTGQNVLVAVNDSGVDMTHPDLSGRVSGFALTDTDGHGTFVAGEIASSGVNSINPPGPVDVGTFAQGSVPHADFRGKAPKANIFSISYGQPDYVLQTNAALVGALISNNSWAYGGDTDYDLAAASYDFATRDALPGTTGSQPVLFVFAAGNSGGGDDSGGGGSSDTIFSPGTAKNVITVGALEQLRNITNIVTTINSDGTTNTGTPWQTATDSGSQVAGYSARGNVGVGTEGNYGRFKPDVVAPGTFVVSTRSGQWATNAYFNPTNVSTTPYIGELVTTNFLNYYSVSVPANAVAVNITITPNTLSPNPFPGLPIYASQAGFPTTADFVGTNFFFIPPGGNSITISSVQNSGFSFAVGDSMNVPVNYDMTVAIYTTNSTDSDYYQVLEGMDDQLGLYYRYESGTSMSAAEVSGVLALIQDYFTNKLTPAVIPSPALLKAILINGARSENGYLIALTNGLNYQGWGLINITNSLPLTSTNLTVLPNGTSPSPLFFVDQSPANALATGDSHTYFLTLSTNSGAQSLSLQATLVWTDPCGDPAAAIKLVNNLDLVITNLDNPTQVYYGNDIASGLGYNLPASTNAPPNIDTINNVENIFLPPLLAGHYSVTVIGRGVNVNAVTAQTNNVVQDYALVVSCGEGEVQNALTVADGGGSSNPTGDQLITFITVTNSPLFNQFVGANSPLLGTNTQALGTNTMWGSSGQLTIGQTNQWHFYVVTNNALDSSGNSSDVTNAAFITFNATTLSIPRTGVYADTVDNATRPEADIDLYVSQDPTLTNLNPVVIANCLAGVNNSRSSLTQGGTEFAFYTNSSPGQVYYIGVKSEDQMASEYSFLAVFTATPFSSLDKNGNQIVNGLLLPVNIPDGNNAHPGVTNVFALAVIPMEVNKVIVTNLNEHQNFGDLFGTLTFGATSVVLNNHDGFHNTFGAAPMVYDDSRNRAVGTTNTDGPGSLTSYRKKSAIGPWILTELDNAQTQTGRVSQFTLLIQPHRDLKNGPITVTIPPGGWFIDYVDVPPGYTNLTFFATNLPPYLPPPPLQMFEKFGAEPSLTDFDQEADLTNCLTGTYPGGTFPGNSISVGPPLANGEYFIGIYNPNLTQDATVLLSATLGFGASSDVFNYSSSGATLLPDDAVTGSIITVPNTVTQLVSSVNVGLVVKSPRISDYTFTLVSPTGQRVLLMENRGASDTNGAGNVFTYTNVLNSTATGGAAANTNYLTVSPLGGVVPITYNFFTVPDEMTVYAGSNAANFSIGSPDFLFDTGFTNNLSGPTTIQVPYPAGITNITIIMNQFGNPFAVKGDEWTYTAGAPITNYQYLAFTDDTNIANVPIKFAVPPFSFTDVATNFTLSDFELATNGDYYGFTNIYDLYGGWTVPTNLVMVSSVFNLATTNIVLVTNTVILTNNLVSVVTDPSDSIGDNVGSNLLALANGTITRSIPTVPGRIYNVTFWYRGPGIESWWRGEGDASDSSDPEKNGNNGTLVGRFNFPAGEVGQAFGFQDGGDQFQFAGTNTYVQFPQSTALDVGKGGGFTVEGWINPTNVAQPQPLVEWLAHVPTNAAVTNIVILAGPYLNRATSHFYYLLGATNWTTSELWATQMGGHLATVDTANEQNWIFDNFAKYGDTNRNLWIGLTNNPNPSPTYAWSSGLTNVVYTNWVSGQPVNCDNLHLYTFMFGATNVQSGLWSLANNNGFVCSSPATNRIYGVVEVNNLQTNGVQFWMSVTNSMPGGTNQLVIGSGCLYANIVDTNFVSHEIYSAPGLIQTNVYQHVALTFNTNSGVAMLFLNGTNVATTNLFTAGGPFVPKTDGDVLLGRDMTLYTNNYFGGAMDEMSIYGRGLSAAEIFAIYWASASATNGLTGKFDPSVTPAPGLAEAEVVFGTTSNLIFGVNHQWQVNSYTFTATSNSMPLRITGVEPGILLDSFAVAESPLTNLYYLPEQALSALTGGSAAGDWQLQVWDNRVGAYVTNFSQLVNWQLSFVLDSNAVVAASLQPQTPTPTTVGPGQTVDYAVTVPIWAKFATNILVSSTYPVDLFFNPTNPPTGSNPGDLSLLTPTPSTGGIGAPVIAVNSPFPLTAANQAGTTYYLGVRNSGIHAASVVLEVDYDILALTNGVPYTSVLTTNAFDAVRYFSFDVTSNAYAATFQLLQMSGNADLVIRKGAPLPTLASSDAGSFNVSNIDETIYLLTNSSPVSLSAGHWYLGVFRRDGGPVTNTVLAKELDLVPTSPTIIELTNGVPRTFTAGPGAALTNFFHFAVTNMVIGGVTNQGLRFEVYNQDGNGDLTVQTNALPFAPPFFQSSQNGGRSPEIIVIHTNTVLTNLVADWYLGVPNHETRLLNYTIVAAVDTNAYFPAFPGATGSGGGAVGGGRLGNAGTVYHVTSLADSGTNTLRDAVSVTNRTVIFDVSGTINLATPLVITNSFLTIAGQTAPGGGITVAGQMTTVQMATNVIIRNVRFRRGTLDDSLQLTNVFNVIADHVSAEWSDNVMSVLNSSAVTVQWSILSDSFFVNGNPPTGSLLRYGNGALSFNHNLYADNYSGSPRLGDNISLDFVNNVVYNWGLFSGLSGGTNDLTASLNGCTNQLNYVCNYLIAGPDTATFGTNYAITNIAFFGGTTNNLASTWIFQTNNFIDSNTNGALDGADTKWAMFTNNYTRFGQPFPLIPVPTDEAFLAYEKVLDFAGVNMSLRDPVDTNIVSRVRNQSGRLISAPPQSGMVAWWKAENNAFDSVGTNNGTLITGAGFAPGEVGQAFSFNGINQYVQVPDNNLWAFGSNSFTIEFWAYFNSSFSGSSGSPSGGLFIGNDEGGGSLNKWFFARGGGLLEFHINGPTINGGAGVFLVKAPFSPTLSKWYHLAITRNGNLYTIYANGVPIGSQTDNTVIPNPNAPLTIGQAEGFYFNGRMDEVSIYKRALSSTEIASIYNAGTVGKSVPVPVVTVPYLDTDQDGIPDFWEMTFTPSLVYTNSNNNDRDGDGYTDLEEYNNWLAAPHALTLTNTPVGVDLQQIFGKTGNLSFSVTNGVNGTVYLTNVLVTPTGSVTNTGPFSNSIAMFTPDNIATVGTNFYGYASFDTYVTNNDTIAYFGPVKVSVVVSAVPILLANNTNTPPVLSTNISGSSFTNNELTLLTVTNTATDANTNLTLSYTLSLSIDTNAMNLLGWTNSFANTTNTVPVINANGIITWTPSEAQGPGVYIITTVVSDNGIPQLSSTNSFSVTVNEVNLAPFWPTNVPSQTNYVIPALNLLVVTNTAQDADLPTNVLKYTLSVSGGVNNAVISSNGIITWTPTLLQVGNYTFTTIVTDTNPYALFNQSLSATNTFTVQVLAVAPPFVFTQPAQAVTGAAAKLNGMVTPNGLPTGAWFQWGTTTNYGSLTPVVNVGGGFNVVYATNLISGLVTNVPYHFRLVASNAAGTNYGFDQILDEANVVAWGADYVGQINVPAGLSNVVAIAGAYDHSLALKNNGGVAAWGDNTFGQATVPVNLSNVLAVAGGEYFSMALKNNSTVTAWGANILGQTNVPPGLTNVITIAGGTYSSLALRTNGAIVAWGANFFNLTNVPANASNIVAIAGGGFHNLAIKNDGTVIAWGDNSAGQTLVPAGLSNVVAIAGGNYHSLALRYNGTVVSWGDDSAGQTNVPVGLSNVVAIAAGGFHSLALKNDGTVVTWGDNSSGQSSVPVGLTNMVAIASGYFHSLTLTPQNFNPTNPVVLPIAGGVAQTNTILGNAVTFYQVNVPTNADFATNSLFFALNGQLNIWFTTNVPPTIAGTNDSLLLSAVTNGVSILSTTSVPTNIVPGSTYYLGVQNTNNFAVNYGIEVDFHLVISTNQPNQTNTVPISSIVYTNISGTNGFMLTWFAPSNALFQVQFTDSLAPLHWITFTNPPSVSYNTNVFTNPTNTQFNFFDNGVEHPFTGTRFYQLILLGSPVSPNTPPVLPMQTNRVINPLNPLIVTNTATDADLPAQTLTYTLSSTVVGTNLPTINTNTGVITWTPDVSQAGSSNMFTTIVTDSGTPNLSATNFFAVIVNPVPNISSILYTNGNFLLTWLAPTNDIFQVQVATNLSSPTVWLTIATNITYTGPVTPTNGWFSYLDNGSVVQFGTIRFYRLNLTGVTLPASAPAPSFTISSILATNSGFLLTWFAPTNDQFSVRWATNIVPPINWNPFPGTNTSTNGTFKFLDTNAPMLMKFYDLILLP